jgi:phosphomethylpyrimidine synthase
MTQLEDAINNRITAAMKQAAAHEGIEPETIRAGVAAGEIVIPKNINRSFDARGIGKGLLTKVNANIGTSPSHANMDEELEKLDASVAAGADAVMDLSTGGDLDGIMKAVIARSPVMIGTVPIYKAVSRVLTEGRQCAEVTEDEIFDEIEHQAKIGVDFVTVHCGITRASVAVLQECNRLMGMVSRGGSLMAEWIVRNQAENPLYESYDRLLDIARAYDVTLSLGDGLRPGTIFDAHDRAQMMEMIILGELAQRARAAGVQVMIEGPGHVPLSRIAADMTLQKRICGGAPYYVLGPLPTDIAAGHDHIAGAIGGAIAAAAGADFLCYVTPAEHLGLPTTADVHDGVIASKIAAHIGDLEKKLPSAWDRDRTMTEARAAFDWETMFSMSVDPQKARMIKGRGGNDKPDVCTMCGDFCALKTHARAFDDINK